MIPIYTDDDFKMMRKAGAVAADCLHYIEPFVVPGRTTAELNQLCEDFMRMRGAIPATIGYKGYEHASCISVNHVAAHGIPSDKRLKEGDILNIDITPILNGWYGDMSRMYTVGKVNVKAQRIIKAAYDSMMEAIAIIKPGVTVGDLGYTMESAAKRERFSVSTMFCGHGIGNQFHTEPSIPYYGTPGSGAVLQKGMIITIEPIVNEGSGNTKVLSDGWTAVTVDRGLSAQWEHTVGVTEDGYEIFTRRSGDDTSASS